MRIQKLLKDHFSGDPWIDVTIIKTLKSISAKQAAQKYGDFNSIWQIVNHMIAWRRLLLARVMEKPVKYSKTNFITPIKDKSSKAWLRTIKNFESSQKAIYKFLSKSQDKMLEEISPSSGYSYYELMLAIVLHDTYHLGQIVLIKKMVNNN